MAAIPLRQIPQAPKGAAPSSAIVAPDHGLMEGIQALGTGAKEYMAARAEVEREERELQDKTSLMRYRNGMAEVEAAHRVFREENPEGYRAEAGKPSVWQQNQEELYKQYANAHTPAFHNEEYQLEAQNIYDHEYSKSGIVLRNESTKASINNLNLEVTNAAERMLRMGNKEAAATFLATNYHGTEAEKEAAYTEVMTKGTYNELDTIRMTENAPEVLEEILADLTAVDGKGNYTGYVDELEIQSRKALIRSYTGEIKKLHLSQVRAEKKAIEAASKGEEPSEYYTGRESEEFISTVDSLSQSTSEGYSEDSSQFLDAVESIVDVDKNGNITLSKDAGDTEMRDFWNLIKEGGFNRDAGYKLVNLGLRAQAEGISDGDINVIGTIFDRDLTPREQGALELAQQQISARVKAAQESPTLQAASGYSPARLAMTYDYMEEVILNMSNQEPYKSMNDVDYNEAIRDKIDTLIQLNDKEAARVMLPF